MTGVNMGNIEGPGSFPEFDYLQPAHATADRLHNGGISLARLDERQSFEHFSNPSMLFVNGYHQPPEQMLPLTFQHLVGDEEGLSRKEPHRHSSTAQFNDPLCIWLKNDGYQEFQDGRIEGFDKRVVGSLQFAGSDSNVAIGQLNHSHYDQGHFTVSNGPINLESFGQENPEESHHHCGLSVGIPIHDYRFKLKSDQFKSAQSFNVDDAELIRQQLVESERSSAVAMVDTQHMNVALPPLSSVHVELEELEKHIERLSEEIQHGSFVPSPPIALNFVPHHSGCHTITNDPSGYLEDHSLLASNIPTSSILTSDQTYVFQNNCSTKIEVQSDSDYTLLPSLSFFEQSPLDIPCPDQSSHSTFVPRGLDSPRLADYSEHMPNFPPLSYHPLLKNPLPPSMNADGETHPLVSHIPFTPPQSSSSLVLPATIESEKSKRRCSLSTENFSRSTTADFDYTTSPSITKKARGRRPLASPYVGLSSNPASFLFNTGTKSVPGGIVFDPQKDFNPNPDLLRLCEVTKTGKFKKLFICQVENCGKCFRRSEHLKRHARTIHTDDKPYKCPWENCKKTFNRHDNLSQHIKIHSR